MPKIFGTNLLGILAATVVFYVLGFLIYGVLFEEQWLDLAGMTKEQAEANAEKLGIMMFVGGIVITLLQVLGISYVLQQSSASVLATCIKIAAILAVFIALPIMAYNCIYQGTHLNALAMDFGHILLGYVLVGAILSFFRGKDAIDPI